MSIKNARGETCFVTRKPLLNENGQLAEPGYATSLILDYDRAAIKASKVRIKEWDYYLINDGRYAIAFTLSDLAYTGLISVSLLDFENGTYKTSSSLAIMPMGKFKMPPNSAEGVCDYADKKVTMHFETAEGVRKLDVTFKGFDGEEDFSASIVLDEEPRDSMVIATPWADDPNAFYYNQKIIAMRASGSFTKGDITHEFDPANSFGMLDWGRGVWTRDNTWFWSASQGLQDGLEPGAEAGEMHRFGFNLGYGFGDTTAASENMVFIDGVAHKLGKLTFGIPLKTIQGKSPKIEDKYALMKPWHFVDEEGRLDLTFTPQIDRFDYTDFKLVISDQHQVFGTFNGKVVLDDGSTFYVKDLIGFAEAVRNYY